MDVVVCPVQHITLMSCREQVETSTWENVCCISLWLAMHSVSAISKNCLRSWWSYHCQYLAAIITTGNAWKAIYTWHQPSLAVCWGMATQAVSSRKCWVKGLCHTYTCSKVEGTVMFLTIFWDTLELVNLWMLWHKYFSILYGCIENYKTNFVKP